MPYPLCYFEIPVTNLDRAILFYQAVFGHEFERGEIDGNLMAFFTADSQIPGALAQGDSYVPSKQGSRLYFKTPSIDDTLARAVNAGATILYPKTSIGPLGWVAEFEDSEGNCIALHADPDTPDQ